MKRIDLMGPAVALAHSLLPDPKVSDVDKCYNALKRAMERQRDNDIATLHSWGDQCCGGAGDQINPESSLPYGDDYYRMARLLADRPIIEP